MCEIRRKAILNEGGRKQTNELLRRLHLSLGLDDLDRSGHLILAIFILRGNPERAVVPSTLDPTGGLSPLSPPSDCAPSLSPCEY